MLYKIKGEGRIVISEKVIKEAFHSGEEKGWNIFISKNLKEEDRIKQAAAGILNIRKEKEFGALKTEICGSCVFKWWKGWLLMQSPYIVLANFLPNRLKNDWN